MYIDKVWGTKLAKNYLQRKGKRLTGTTQLVYYINIYYILNLELIYVYYIKEIGLVFFLFFLRNILYQLLEV